MVSSRICQLHALAATAALVAGGCSLFGSGAAQAAPGLGIDPSAVIDLGDSAAAPHAAAGGGIEVLVVRKDQTTDEWVSSPITSAQIQPGVDSLRLLTYGGATDEAFNSFVYGGASPGVARVELIGLDGRGGDVVNGLWLIALPHKDMTPDDIDWRFLGADGSLLSQGTGSFPPDA